MYCYIMGLLKKILEKCSCKSSCMYNIDEELYDRRRLDIPISHYELKIKDVKKIMKILNKRQYLTYPRYYRGQPIIEL